MSLIFFFKQKTAYEMRISDWSSDVCSSDLPYQSPDAHSALHLYPVQIEDASQRRRVFEGMRTAGIGVNVHYIPVHLQPYYRRLGHATGRYPHAEAYYSRALSLPIFPTLKDAQQDHEIGRAHV